jgi:hypothetical protein
VKIAIEIKCDRESDGQTARSEYKLDTKWFEAGNWDNLTATAASSSSKPVLFDTIK